MTILLRRIIMHLSIFEVFWTYVLKIVELVLPINLLSTYLDFLWTYLDVTKKVIYNGGHASRMPLLYPIRLCNAGMERIDFACYMHVHIIMREFKSLHDDEWQKKAIRPSCLLIGIHQLSPVRQLPISIYIIFVYTSSFIFSYYTKLTN